MHIELFYDTKLAHASYAILSDGEVALVDPARDPQPYLHFAKAHNARITKVLETHPHADFVSSHLEFINEHGATTYVHPRMGVLYPHQELNDGETVAVGSLTVKALFTPGHSPDHNSYLLYDEAGRPHAVFTGDSLFIGDVGRPDLREGAGNMVAKREELAGQMFDSLWDVFAKLPDEVLVYPAHGAGSLCGKSLSTDTSSTIGREKQFNWAFQITDRAAFIDALLEGQPFVPKYFPHSVEVNRKGAPPYEASVLSVPRLDHNTPLPKGALVVDIREATKWREGHLSGSFNIPNSVDDRFETWTGAIIGPEEKFYLLGDDDSVMENALRRLAKIGYEVNVLGTVVCDASRLKKSVAPLDVPAFRRNPEDYTVVDIRNESEVETAGKKYDHALVVPLHQLRERVSEIPTHKPVVLHCAGGYRSSAGASILETLMPETTVFDLGESVKEIESIAV